MEAAKEKQEFRDLVEGKGGCIIGDIVSELSDVHIRCKRNHEWHERVLAINLGAWCPECEKIPLKDAVTDLLVESEYEYQVDCHVIEDIIADWAVVVEFKAVFGSLDAAVARKLSEAGRYCAHVTTADLMWLNRARPLDRRTTELGIRMFPIGTQGRSYYKDSVLSATDAVLNVVGYCRTNIDLNPDELPIESQEAAIKEYCATHHLSIRRVYYDVGLPGGDMKRRFGLRRMLEEIGKGDTIIVSSICRLSRITKDLLIYYDNFVKKGAHFCSLNPEFDTSTPEGQLVFKAYAAVANEKPEEKADTLSTTSHNGRGTAKSRSKPPFGWRFVGPDLPHEKDADEQRIIEKIRRFRLEEPRLNLSGICRHLNEDGDSCRYAKEWRVTTLQRIMIQNDIPMIKPHDRDI